MAQTQLIMTTTTLTPEEESLVAHLGFDREVAVALKMHTGKPLRRAEGLDDDFQTVPADGIAADVRSGESAEQVMKALGPMLPPGGYRAFWSLRTLPLGSRESDEVIILKTADPHAVVRLRQTNGSNYDVSHEDVLARLAAWEALCKFEVVGASSDWVALVFATLPEKICEFAAEVYGFCPDSVEQGVGLMREEQDPELFAAARKLCPQVRKVRPTPAESIAEHMKKLPPDQAAKLQFLFDAAAKAATVPDDGVRLLAETLRRKKYLFLWWD
jgi:hypothetical protein